VERKLRNEVESRGVTAREEGLNLSCEKSLSTRRTANIVEREGIDKWQVLVPEERRKREFNPSGSRGRKAVRLNSPGLSAVCFSENERPKTTSRGGILDNGPPMTELVPEGN